MGFIRGSLFVIVSVLLFLSFLGLGFFYMVSMSLEYDVVKEELVTNADGVMRQMGVYDDFADSFSAMSEYCSVNGDIFSFRYQGNVFEIPCEVVLQGSDAVFYYSLEDFVMDSYYDDYDCSLFDCWEETKSPNFLISEKTKDYAWNKVYFLIFVSLILVGLMFVLIEKRSNLPFVVGGLLVFVSLIFMKIDSMLLFIEDKIILSFLSIFLTESYNVFLRFMFFGVLILIIGFVWKFFIIGFKVNRLVSWIKKKIEERRKRVGDKKRVEEKKSLVKRKKGEVAG